MKLSFPLKIAANAILAGISISLGTYVYLQVQGLTGAVLYSVGLLAVVYYQFILYTGAGGKVHNLFELACLIVVLMLNGIGCWAVSLGIHDPAIIQLCEYVVRDRGQLSFWGAMMRGMGCGFVLTMAMQCWKDNKWSLLIGAPAFILAGFTHSVTDIFYYCIGFSAITKSAVWALCGTIVGNFVGGNVYQLGTSEIKK